MEVTATSLLRLGVVGLGRHWKRRYRHLVRRRSLGYAVTVVHDARLATARSEAKRLGCAAADGIVELVQHPDVDAVLLCDPAWHGLWPVEQARRLGKPVLCIPPVSAAGEHAAEVLARLRDSGPVVVFERFTTDSPAVQRLLHLVADDRLGKPDVVTCDVPSVDQEQALGMVDLILTLFSPGAPTRTMPEGLRTSEVGGLRTWQLGFPGGRAAQITIYPVNVRHLRLSARVTTSRASARIRFPDQLYWSHDRFAGRIDWRGRFELERATLCAFRSLVQAPGDWQARLRWLEEAWSVIPRMGTQAARS